MLGWRGEKLPYENAQKLFARRDQCLGGRALVATVDTPHSPLVQLWPNPCKLVYWMLHGRLSLDVFGGDFGLGSLPLRESNGTWRELWSTTGRNSNSQGLTWSDRIKCLSCKRHRGESEWLKGRRCGGRGTREREGSCVTL
jgi:hypothetical protein